MGRRLRADAGLDTLRDSHRVQETPGSVMLPVIGGKRLERVRLEQAPSGHHPYSPILIGINVTTSAARGNGEAYRPMQEPRWESMLLHDEDSFPSRPYMMA